jgi:hypothetical protein
MTPAEFQNRIQEVSDRRLQRMIDRALAEGPIEALTMLEAEKQRRLPKPPTATHTFGRTDLTSQIRPLEEVLGDDFHMDRDSDREDVVGALAMLRNLMPEPEVETWTPGTRHDSISGDKTFFLDASLDFTADIRLPASQDKGSAPEGARVSLKNTTHGEADLMGKSQVSELAANQEDVFSAPKKSRGRGLAVVAIVLLFVAGCLAIWRALVG